MKKTLIITGMLVFMISNVFALDGEYQFTISNRPADTSLIGISANVVPNTLVFGTDLTPTSSYNSAVYYTKGDYMAFDWVNDPNYNSCPEIAYGLYKMSIIRGGKSAYFYFDLRDCYYGECGIDPPSGSDYVSPLPLDMYFTYNFKTDKFSGQRRFYNGLDSIVVDYIPIDNGDTIGIWFVREDYPDGGTACTFCFNPKVYLYNEYGSNTNFGQLVIDDTNYVDSGDSVYLFINTSHSVMSEQDKYVILGDSIQQRYWDLSMTDIVFKKEFSVNSWRISKRSRFKELIPCTIQTASLNGGNCDRLVEFKDPWKIEANYTRPNIYHTYGSPFYPGNGYGVFLNENEDFLPDRPIYSLRAPSLEDDGDLISIFSHWSVSPSGGAELDEDSPETDVVFKTSGVVVTANYYQYRRSAFQGSVPIALTIDGNIHVTGTVTVQSAGELTLPAGSNLSFDQSKSLYVYGKLTGSGTSSNKINFKPSDPNTTLDNYWNGIRAMPGGNVILQHANIKNGQYGLYSYQSRSRATYCQFENNHRGLHILYGDGATTVDGCHFINNMIGAYFQDSNILIANSHFNSNQWGIRISRCTGTITTSIIEESETDGIGLLNYSNLSLSTQTKNLEYVNNSILNNDQYGIYIDSYSHPILGNYYIDFKDYIHGGFNEFDRGDGDYDVYSANTSTIDARLNWWVESSNLYGNFLLYPSAGDLGLKKPTYSFNGTDMTSPSALTNRLFQADSLAEDSLFVPAISAYRSIVADYPDSDESVYAVTGLIKSYRALGKEDRILPELDIIRTEQKNTHIGNVVYDLSISELIRMGEYSTALSRNLELLDYYQKNNQNPEEMAFLLLNQAFIYQRLNNGGLNKLAGESYADKSRGCLDKLCRDFPKSQAAQLYSVLEDVYIPDNDKNNKKVTAPDRFQLFTGNPNPFNASTTIRFDLPEQIKIEIVIYDLTGQEVWRTTKTNYPAGSHSLVWNGVNRSGQLVSTGMYIIQLNSPKYQAVQKVVLMK